MIAAEAEAAFRRELSAKLNAARLAHRWSVREVAKRAEMSRAGANCILTGSRRMTLRSLFRLAQAMDMELRFTLSPDPEFKLEPERRPNQQLAAKWARDPLGGASLVHPGWEKAIEQAREQLKKAGEGKG